MLFGYLTLATALIISLSAAVYSILGLTAIFAAAFWPIVVMGGSLEFGKIVTTLWLHKYWNRAEIQYKVYLCSAVAILMLLTSMGVFGFLSKAHSDQGLVSGDVTSKLAIYDEKIKISRDNIDANRKALTQMDTAVDQVMGRSTDEKGADKAVQIRRSQSAERTRLLKEIEAEQKKITALNDEAAPIRAEVRKVDAEVGPIKYIAALIYGDNPDANILEKSVRWVIILIVIVFDPLALTLLLAATKALEWERGIDIFAPKKKDDEDNDADEILRKGVTNSKPEDNAPLGEMVSLDAVEQQALQEALHTEYFTEPEVKEEKKNKVLAGLDSMWMGAKKIVNQDTEAEHAPIESPTTLPVSIDTTEILVDNAEENSPEKIAERLWKIENPNKTLKRERQLLRAGIIDHLPWLEPEFFARAQTHTDLQADNEPYGSTGEVRGFGSQFPKNPSKGDMFLRVDRLPSALFKFNGASWIEVDKHLSDNYAYDAAYIDHLINKIDSGEYDPDLLSDAEREHITNRLNR